MQAIAALTAADLGRKVTIITKTDELLSGNTPYAQGGIIYKGNSDSGKKLKKDIIKAGGGHCWEPAVDQTATMGPSLVEEFLINKYKMPMKEVPVRWEHKDTSKVKPLQAGIESFLSLVDIKRKDMAGEYKL